jgi:hypothetical protein
MFRTLAAEASPSVSPDNTKVRLDLEEPEGRFRADIFAGLIFARFQPGRKNFHKKNASFHYWNLHWGMHAYRNFSHPNN